MTKRKSRSLVKIAFIAGSVILVCATIVGFIITRPKSFLSQNLGLLKNSDGRIVSCESLDVGYSENVGCYRLRYLSDGLQVVGFLIKPKQGNRYPAVIYNRGGNLEYGKIDNLTLAYLSYIVSIDNYVFVASQYRGNDGGEGREEFGGSDVNDVLNLIPMLESLPFVDSSKIAMFGVSRGGMETYEAITMTDKIKAACVIGGVTDLIQTYNERPDMRQILIDLIGGTPEEKENEYIKRSAYYWPEKINTPVLILHGGADWRVDVSQAEKLAGKLENLGKTYKLVVYPGASHGLSENARDVLDRIHGWFENYLKSSPKEKFSYINEGLASSPWPKWRGDASNTGRSSSVGAPDNAVMWSLRINDGDVAFEGSSAVGKDGTIYIGSGKQLIAVDSEGKIKWIFETKGGGIESTPAIAKDGTIYVTAFYTVPSWVVKNPELYPMYPKENDCRLYAINPDGTLKWFFSVSDWIWSSPAVGPDGTIYFGCNDSKLYAVNPSGSLKWTFATEAYIMSSPAIALDGTVYIGSEDHRLYAVNPDGTLKWSFQTGSSVSSSPAVADDGTIYFGSWDDNLYALNPNGILKWSLETDGVLISSPAIAADGTVYIGSENGTFYAVSADGIVRWTFKTLEMSVGVYENGRLTKILRWQRETIYSSPAVSADGFIYFGSAWPGGKLYALDSTGTLRWTFDTGHEVRSSPIIGADGIIYFYSSDGNLYAIGGPGGISRMVILKLILR